MPTCRMSAPPVYRYHRQRPRSRPARSAAARRQLASERDRIRLSPTPHRPCGTRCRLPSFPWRSTPAGRYQQRLGGRLSFFCSSNSIKQKATGWVGGHRRQGSGPTAAKAGISRLIDVPSSSRTNDVRGEPVHVSQPRQVAARRRASSLAVRHGGRQYSGLGL